LKKEKIIHIPNAIDINEYQRLPQRGEFRKRHLMDMDDKMILFLSRIHERKGLDLLIHSFNELKPEIPKIRLVIAGPDEGYLSRLLSITRKLNLDGDVIFPGPLYERDKMEAYVDADVFVLPSKDKQESFGNVVLEAGMCKTSSVVTDVCGVTEYLDNIFLTKPSIPSIRNGIVRALEESDVGSRIRNEVIQKFDWKKIIRMVERVYEEEVDDSP
ncbi:MAG: glycosyltransferase, partial [Candidatus Thorarchaeota archaeon]